MTFDLEQRKNEKAQPFDRVEDRIGWIGLTALGASHPNAVR